MTEIVILTNRLNHGRPYDVNSGTRADYMCIGIPNHRSGKPLLDVHGIWYWQVLFRFVERVHRITKDDMCRYYL